MGAFTRWLVEDGWDVTTSRQEADAMARRGAEILIAEVKGTTMSPGLDVDTMYGQLLRRMTPDAASARFAVVVPRSAAAAVARVSTEMRARLQIDAYVVEMDGTVTPLS